MSHEEIGNAFAALGYVGGFAFIGDESTFEIVVWNHEAKQPTLAELKTAAEKQKTAATK